MLIIAKLKTRFVFYSVRALIYQQSPKLALKGSNMGLVLVVSANLITKASLSSFMLCNYEPADPHAQFILYTATLISVRTVSPVRLALLA